MGLCNLQMVGINRNSNVWNQETYIQQDFEMCKMILDEPNDFSMSGLLARNSDTIGCMGSNIDHVLEFWMGHCRTSYNSKLTWLVATSHSIEASRKVSCKYGITFSETFLSTRWPLICCWNDLAVSLYHWVTLTQNCLVGPISDMNPMVLNFNITYPQDKQV